LAHHAAGRVRRRAHRGRAGARPPVDARPAQPPRGMTIRTSSTSSAQALSLDLGGRLDASRTVAHRWSRFGVQTALALAIVPMVAVTLSLAATSDHLTRPLAAALYWS